MVIYMKLDCPRPQKGLLEMSLEQRLEILLVTCDDKPKMSFPFLSSNKKYFKNHDFDTLTKMGQEDNLL
jgi:hypothetical protein